MEAKELMIGDWVRGTSEVVGRVKGISENDVLVRTLYGDTWADGEILPIPITPKILEKNFPIADGCEYRDDNNGICIEIYFNAKTEKYKKYAILYTDRGKIYIDRYVHQLQHALRLCGIEKEIIL